jgi:hypothetical protein
MKKTSTVRVNGNMIFKGHKLTIAVDLGDHRSCYCVWMKRGKSFWNRKWRTVGLHAWHVFQSASLPLRLLSLEQVRSCFGATTAPRPAGNVAE